jgi:transposase InsO family protein
VSPKGETPLPLPVRFLAAWIGVWLGRYQQQLIEYQREEIQLLRQKLGDRRLRFSDGDRRRLAVLGKKLGRRALGQVATVATPDTILRWYRELIAKKYDGRANRGPGRPGTVVEVIRLLVRMARENPSWGYTRLRGALKNLGHELGRNTIKRILREQGIDPAPTRKRSYSWETFIRAHLGAIAAADFFTVEVMGLLGLVRMYVFFVIDLANRKVEVVGICRQPDALWMDQMARNLLDAVDGFLRGKRYLLVDRDPLYTREFREGLAREGTEVARLPARSPNLNAFAERFVLSIRSECLDRIIPLGERHLRRAVSEYLKHYHQERNHQGLGNVLIDSSIAANDRGRVRRRQRLGGLLSYYHREAA